MTDRWSSTRRSLPEMGARVRVWIQPDLDLAAIYEGQERWKCIDEDGCAEGEMLYSDKGYGKGRVVFWRAWSEEPAGTTPADEGVVY